MPRRMPTQAQISEVLRILSTLESDFYAILGVSSTATQEQIKRAFKKISMLCHPDKNGDSRASRAFVAVNNAFDTLGDREKRGRWEEEKRMRGGGEGGGERGFGGGGGGFGGGRYGGGFDKVPRGFGPGYSGARYSGGFDDDGFGGGHGRGEGSQRPRNFSASYEFDFSGGSRGRRAGAFSSRGGSDYGPGPSGFAGERRGSDGFVAPGVPWTGGIHEPIHPRYQGFRRAESPEPMYRGEGSSRASHRAYSPLRSVPRRTESPEPMYRGEGSSRASYRAYSPLRSVPRSYDEYGTRSMRPESFNTPHFMHRGEREMPASGPSDTYRGCSSPPPRSGRGHGFVMPEWALSDPQLQRKIEEEFEDIKNRGYSDEEAWRRACEYGRDFADMYQYLNQQRRERRRGI